MRRTRWRWSVWAGVLALGGCGGESGEPPAREPVEDARLARVQAASPEEGRMGTSSRQAGQYAMKQYDSDPQLARQQALRSRRAGALRPFSPSTGSRDFSSGVEDRDVYGGLVGNEVGEMQGGWGLARVRANTEDYARYRANPATATSEDRLSTFAIDVDTASYSIARRKLLEGQPVPAAAVRVEEFVNYFRYDYEGPTGDAPFAVHMDAAPSPFDESTHLLRVGVQGKRLSKSERKRANLVFLVDVSGSMGSADKLGLAKRSLKILVDNLNDGDTVAIVTYAGAVEKVLDPTGIEHRAEILSALDSLQSGGGTSMGSGVEIAYRLAAKTLSDDSISRVIVLSDGDANIGRTSHEQILETIAGHVKEGVTLSTIGFGMGNYKDTMMEQLANRGNGNYYYVDSIQQARRVFQEQLGSALEVIAKDVKIQVEFHEQAVKSYRLVGYENRDIADADFRNDRVDAGEIGAGHSVTALYEVVLTGDTEAPLATVRLRAKPPRGEKATETVYLFDRARLAPRFSAASRDFRFAAAVMGAAEILRGSPWKMSTVVQIAREASDGSAEREEFVRLMRGAGV